ncbi:NAD-glutamate dehydrogenase [Tsukamurella pseudospumae]|uniref:NAD-glutamate dehydrogenase n=1 Tax=Tsukamurella pseudospumae TaxID=239498 RepID=A0A137ZQS5_9ACTN|nr:NAD-glutamate dehydrogenase domain-containing protein [Tsukamurella pseudospumae]KXP00541.1 NAD-glutamate dehydrogenase [Tsukamurella pseudospumae]
MEQSAHDPSDFTRAAASVGNQPPGRSPSDFLTWLSEENARILGTWTGDAGTGVLSDPDDKLRAVIDAMPAPEAGGIGVVELAQPLGDAAGSPFLLAASPSDGGPTELFAMAMTVLGLHHNVFGIPMVGAKIERVLARIGVDRSDPANQRLMEFIQTYPRLRLVVADEDELARVFGALRDLGDEDLALFLRTDKLARFARALVYLPRDRYTSRARGVLIDVLEDETGMRVDRFTARVTESAIARIQFVLLPRAEGAVPVFQAADEARIRARLGDVSRTWDEDVLAAATAAGADAALVREYLPGISPNYKEDAAPEQALADVTRIAGLAPDGQDLVFYDPRHGDEAGLRFAMYVNGGRVTLSQALPMLQSLGVDVLDERPYKIRRPDGVLCSVYDFGLRVPAALTAAAATGVAESDLPGRYAVLRGLASDGAAAAWRGDAEVDRFNELILSVGLDWRRVALLRAIGQYLRQCGFPYSPGHMAQVLLEHRDAALALDRLWTATFDPIAADADAAAQAETDVVATLEAVTSLDADRILRAYLHVVQATVRTNFYADKPVISIKLEPGRVPEAPKPRPRFEIFVYSPRVEGVHLRFGMVARGGLRWSDRREDFRTEVLGLVKAQAVKNAVIVPVGAKGGFVVKQPPEITGDATVDRDAQRAEGVACYRMFISGLLDVTDNLGPDGAVLPPERVVRRDADDTYLVVAADKGTASFSDIANDVAAGYDFWLGDAFASGGSEGYDHKGMGITARGAWESVKMHFREMGVDTQSEDFTAVGVGDMSGDVFGNGMLLSEHIRLVAAFDHRDIFLDPNPDAAVGFAERQRLFDLPRSSWKDYDTSTISEGGGVFSRDTKSVPISPQVRTALGLADDVTELTPPELMRAVLLAPVDLLWNGGIGTYIKASTETDLAVGDRANDAIRVDGNQLRAKVVGEGGNLGVTPLGRIEFDRSGGRINTDAMDNSAGVDCSDHEVNIKILLDRQIAAGAIGEAERHDLLVSMTDDVSRLVLADNVSQNTALSVERSLAPKMVDVHARILADLSRNRGVDLRLEALPTRKETDRLQAAGLGLSSPELCNLMAHVKLAVKDDVIASDLPDNDALAAGFPAYFPDHLRDRAGDAVFSHPLRREIVATQAVNELVDNAGVSFVYRLQEETGAAASDAVRAFVAVSRVFDLPATWAAVKALPTSAAESAALLSESRRVLDRAARWMLTNRPQPIAIGAEVNRYADRIAAMTAAMPDWDIEYDAYACKAADHAREAGVPDDLAYAVSRALYRFSLLDVVDIADITEREDDEVGRLYFALMQHLRIDKMLGAVAELPRGDRWSEMARLALRDDLYGALRALTVEVLNFTDPDEPATQKIGDWASHHAQRLERVGALLAEILDPVDGAAAAANDESRLSVATRALRSLLRHVG